ELRAKQSIPRGTRITPEMVELAETPTPAADALTAIGDINNTYATENIAAGQPILRGKLHTGPWKVLVARSALVPGARLDETNLTLREMPELPEGALEDADRAKVVGRICRTTIRAGQLINSNDFYAQNSTQLSYLIPIYKRAITIQIKAADLANSYLIRLGDNVDVLARFPEHFAGVDVTRTVVQSATVLALDNRMERAANAADTGGFSFVTLAVTPREAEKLSFANKHAEEIRLVLRSPLATGDRTAENTTRTDILGNAYGQPRNVEVYNGSGAPTTQTVRDYQEY
ncbi:MAG TPA: Flp pilus assembly protein CpaB, partial [bacterium]|nr:Flp pilus assembly protein CpaB [bacterium]